MGWFDRFKEIDRKLELGLTNSIAINHMRDDLKQFGIINEGSKNKNISYGIVPFSIGNINNQTSNIIGNNINRYKSVTRASSPTSPARSHPIMDIFRMQLPSFKTGSLGIGHKYRVIGNNAGLKDVVKNGIVSKGAGYKNANQVYWAENEPLREYTKNSALMVSYDKNGKYIFGRGNFDNPVSTHNNPIKFNDPNIRLHGRYPFSSKYHEIPKTIEGIKHANRLGYANRFIEQPIRKAIKGYLYYKLYDKYRTKTKSNKK